MIAAAPPLPTVPAADPPASQGLANAAARRRQRAERPSPSQPLVGYCLALMLGIVADRCLSLPIALSLALSIAALCAWILFHRRGSAAGALSLWLATAFLGAAWHHQQTRVFSDDDIGNFTSSNARLCHIRGELLAEPTQRKQEPATRRSWRANETSELLVAVSSLASDDIWRPVEGRLSVYIGGPAPAVHRGDHVELFGWLSRPSTPGNAGEFDYADYLQGRRVRATLFCETPQAVRTLANDSRWPLARWRDELRLAANRLLQKTLSEKNAALASAILLGERATMNREELAPFLESGTLHLLVVSGSHLTLLAAGLWLAGSVVGLSFRLRAVSTILIVVGYAFLTGGDPPVARGAVVATLFLAGYLVDRPIRPLNSLAAAALVILAMDPGDLFRSGPQLSFVAVLAILCFGRVLVRQRQPSTSATAWSWLAAGIWTKTRDAFWISFVVWTITAPLLAFRFHLFTPVGVLLTPPLIVLLTVSMILGPLLFLTASLVPIAAAPIAAMLGWTLGTVQWGAELAERTPWGFTYLPAPPGWWTLGLYLVLFLPLCFVELRKSGWVYLAANVCWLAVGAALVALPRTPSTLELHQLAVGHGNCAVFRLPTGQNVLYDCGSMTGPMVTERVIAPWLWENGIGSLDAVLLSHADVDHFNGLIELARRFPIGAVYVTPQFARSADPGVNELYRELSGKGIPFRFVWAYDRLIAGDATLAVLQPPATGRFRNDNGASITMECSWRGRTILMTGDLEGEGLGQLLSEPVRRRDVFIAPHHGSRLSNNPQVAAWAFSQVVVSSQGRRPQAGDPLAAYVDVGSLTLRTDRDGAVSIRFLDEGLEVQSFRSGRRFLLP